MANDTKHTPGPWAILVNNGFRYEYHTTVLASSFREAREMFKQTGDWRADDFRVRDERTAIAKATGSTK